MSREVKFRGKTEMSINEKVEHTYNALDIAEYFISKSLLGTRQNITNLKLQKLLYYAQGFHYATQGRLLFRENIHARPHGSTVPDVYAKYKKHNFTEIKQNKDYDLKLIDKATRDFLDKVWNVFKNYTGKQLEQLLRQEEPYLKASKRKDKRVDVEDMREYFNKHYV